MTYDNSPATGGSQSAKLFLYWLIVGIPLVWGVAQSVNAALPLFGGKSAYIPWVIGAPPVKAAQAATSVSPVASASPKP